MAHFNALSKICAQYNISFDIQTIIEEHVNKKLFMKGWRTMQSFDKNTQKIKKLDKKYNRYRHEDKHNLECYDTIQNLYLENPRRGFYNFLQEYSKAVSSLTIIDLIQQDSGNYNYNLIDNVILCESCLPYFEIRSVKCYVPKTIPELREWIEENTDYCQKNKLKKSFKKPELIRIIIHGDPKGSIRK
jgi:hypothetical protein